MAIPATSPSTNVTFYKGCTLNKDYQHVFYYSDQAAQDGYFNTLTSKTYNTILYQNFTDKTIRVGIPIKDLLGYNYFTFINDNSSYERKKFYCFIDNMISVNNNATEILYTVDVFNTFAFDYAVRECYIKRQHASNDNMYKHLEPEPITDGVYTTNYTWQFSDETSSDTTLDMLDMSHMGNILIVNEDPDNGYAPTTSPITYTAGDNGQIIVTSSLMYGGAINPYDTTLPFLYGLISQMIHDGHSQAILGCYLCPLWIIKNFSVAPWPNGRLRSIYASRDLKFNITHSSLDGYIPRNKKLWTYPYRYFSILSSEGTGTILKYELNNTNQITLRQYGVAVGQNGVNISTVPVGYNGFTFDWGHNIGWSYNEQMILTKDNLADWWRQNASAVGIGAISTGLSSVTGLMGNFLDDGSIGGALSAGMQIPQYFLGLSGQMAKVKDSPTVSFGFCNTSSARSAGHLGVFCYDMCYRKQDLKRIDAFFDRYGYSVNALGVPGRYNRENYTYVQTVGSNVKSLGTNYLNSEFISQINDAFDRGITFWYSGGLNAYSNIGNFSQSVVSSNVPLES